jgi:hypothetical protein
MMTDKDRRGDINITNNFIAPIGQHIDHVDTINFRMDGDGTFHFGMVEEAKTTSESEDRCKRDEELFHFVHPELDDDEAWRVHDAVKRVVKLQGLQMICQYLSQLRNENKVLLPPNPSAAYAELVRMGMPSGEGFNEITFRKYYNKS